MPNQADLPSHCVVQWEDKNNNQLYAIVDTKRAKTVSTLKVGVTVVFEGYQRERRRGKVLFLGTKKDCFTFGFDVAEHDEQLNTYSWSGPPGLREQTDEVSQAIRNGSSCSSSFQRTISTSSTSSVTLVNKPKRKKLADKNQNDIDHSTTSNDKAMPAPPPSSTSTISLSTAVNSITTNDVNDPPLNSNNQSSSIILNSSSTNTEKNGTKSLIDINSSLEENKSLREKNLALQGELLYQKENSIPIPSVETYEYLKSVCSIYEQVKSERNQKAIELGKELPCSEIELKLARTPRPAATINNLVKYCFKNVDLKNSSYEKLKAIDKQTLDNIHNYVKFVHAPQVISQSKFSETISLRFRHMREGDKNKTDVSKSTKRNPTTKPKGSKRNNEIRKENIPPVSNEELIEHIDQEQDNSNDTF